LKAYFASESYQTAAKTEMENVLEAGLSSRAL
jgi:hypothetical protein